MKLALILTILLICRIHTHELASEQQLNTLKSLLRRLQNAKPADPKPTPATKPVAPKPPAGPDNGSHPKDWEGQNYQYDPKLGGPGLAPISPRAFPESKDTWSKARQEWYDAEGKRLYAQRTFHTEELKRYEIQEELNEKRRKIELDDSKTIKERYYALDKLDRSYELAIVTQDTVITRVQVLRNPANVVARNAKREFDTGVKNSKSTWEETLKESAGALDAKKAIRRLAPDASNAEAQMKNLWTDRYNKFKDQYTLNFVFHKSEFLEFARDEQLLEDMRANWEDKTHTALSKSYRNAYIQHQYNQERGPIQQFINRNNQARNKAQGIKNNAEKAVRNFYNHNRKTFDAKL